MDSRITIIKPRGAGVECGGLRSYEVIVVSAGRRTAITVVAPTGLIANQLASAIQNGQSRPLFFPEVA